MKHFTLYIITVITLFSCTSDENSDILNRLNTKIYNLESVSDPAITGLVEFTENPNGSISVEIELINTIEGETYPAQINMNTAVETGAVIIDLEPVIGATGKSNTLLTTFNDGSPILYSDILTIDAYLNVSLSTNPNILVAQTDIGENELTGLSKTYNLVEENASGITGTVNFFERNNGEALSVISLNDAVSSENYLAEIRNNDTTTSGTTVFTYNSIDGDLAETKINLANLDGQTDFFGYENLLEFDGHITVTNQNTSTIIAQANVGINEEDPTAQTLTYDVSANDITAYVFNGNGLIATENPSLTFVRGNTYILNLNVTGQPFYIKTAQTTGTTDLYNDGVTGNGSETGTIEFTVSQTAPDVLFYNSEFEVGMSGAITIID